MSNLAHIILTASLVTLGIAVSSLILGMLFAMILVVLEGSKKKIIRYPTSTLVTLIRGLPELLVVFLVFYGSTHLAMLLTGRYIQFNSFLCGTIALAIIFAAYASQYLRSAILAIPKGQWESGTALGFSTLTTFLLIILPQVWRHALPGLSNQWLVLLKDTALVSFIGVTDIMRTADIFTAATRQPFTWYACAALIYLAITLLSQCLIHYLNQHLTRFEKEVA